MAILQISKNAAKRLSKMPVTQAKQVREVLDLLAGGQTAGLDIKRLKNSEFFRLRVGKYRVQYGFRGDGAVLTVIKLGPRGDFYK